MHGVFKKSKTKNRNIDIAISNLEFFKRLILSLPEKYHFIVGQLTPSFLLYRYENKSIGDGWFSFGFDQKQLEFFEASNINFPPRRTSNIYIESNKNEKFKIELYFITKGIFCAYKILPNIDLNAIIMKSINSEGIVEEIFQNKELELFKETLNKVVENTVINYLDIEDSFVLDSFDKGLRTIKYFGNGNYLCVDNELNILKAYNDPHELVETKVNLKQVKSIDEINKLIVE